MLNLYLFYLQMWKAKEVRRKKEKEVIMGRVFWVKPNKGFLKICTDYLLFLLYWDYISSDRFDERLIKIFIKSKDKYKLKSD